MNLDNLGYVCPVLSEKETDRSYSVVGQVGYAESEYTLLVDESGKHHHIKERDLNEQFDVENRIAVNPFKGSELKGVALYCPLMKKFSGEPVVLLALGLHKFTGKRYAIYRALERGSYWAEQIESFYDRFAPTSAFVFGDRPRIIDPDGSMGFVVNEGADDVIKHPPLIAYYDESSGDFTLSD